MSYVHHWDARLMKFVDGPLWRDTDGTDEQTSLFFDDNIDELRKLALRVVILSQFV